MAENETYNQETKRQSIKIGKYLLEQSPLAENMVSITILGDGEGGWFGSKQIEKLINDGWSEIF